jgi:hypothetical protein
MRRRHQNLQRSKLYNVHFGVEQLLFPKMSKIKIESKTMLNNNTEVKKYLSRYLISRYKNCVQYRDIFFNIEHSPYLFPMFSFKKHRSMHVCNHVTKVTKISKYILDSLTKWSSCLKKKYI